MPPKLLAGQDNRALVDEDVQGFLGMFGGNDSRHREEALDPC